MLALCSFCLAVIVTIHYPPLDTGRLAIFCCLLAALAVAARFQRRWLPVLPAVLLGVLYSHFFVMQRIDNVLPKALEQQDLALDITISDVPVDRGHYRRSTATVNHHPFLHKVLLNWYGERQPAACERWQLTVRLKRPHGLANPGAFDYALYLLEQGIQGKGYVREARRLATGRDCLGRLRSNWHDYLLAALPESQAVWLIALSTGDKSRLTREQYRLLQRAGINHLFVISGLHIGLAAGLVYGLVTGIRRIGGGLLYNGDWRPVAAIAAMLAALAYAALAGFTLPAQRAVIMVVVFLAGAVAGVSVSLWRRYWLAMTAVLLYNPLAAANIGFALSFAAVAVLLLLGHSFRPGRPGRLGHLRWLWRTQWMIALGLAPFLLMFFGQASLLAPIVNLLAIPVVSLLVVPLVLLAFLAWLLAGSAGWAVVAANQLVQWLLGLIGAFDAVMQPLLAPVAGWSPGTPGLLIITVMAGLLLMPPLVRGRAVSVALLALLLLLAEPPRPPQGGVFVDVIDVGQGLSVLLTTKDHALLYDTGSAWEHGSMAEFAVLPLLRQRGIAALDTLLLSHFDNDHAGGREVIRQALPVGRVLASSQRAGVDKTCRRGDSWLWDGVRFSILHPPATGDFPAANNQSCVLLVEAGGRQLLLPGDIDRQTEMAMLKSLPASETLDVDVLLAPHHGSRSSSSWALLAQSRNARVIFSSGYLNRYRHPHPSVLERYRQGRRPIFNTAVDGAVQLAVSPDGGLHVEAFRQRYADYPDLLYQRPNP